MTIRAEAINEFLIDLKHEGFDVSVTDFIRANKLLVAFTSRGEEPETFVTFAERLSVLVCRNAGDQAHFHNYLVTRFPNQIEHKPVSDSPSPQKETRDAMEDPAALELNAFGRKRFWSTAGSAVLLLLIADLSF